MQRETRDDGEGRQVCGPDGLQRLWTPHRMAYIKGENKPHGNGPDDGCPFCRAPSAIGSGRARTGARKNRFRAAQPLPL